MLLDLHHFPYKRLLCRVVIKIYDAVYSAHVVGVTGLQGYGVMGLQGYKVMGLWGYGVFLRYFIRPWSWARISIIFDVRSDNFSSFIKPKL